MDERYNIRTFDKMSSKNPEQSSRVKTPWWKRYRWRMRHYFYIHVLIFIFNGLLGGLIVFLIENYLKPNRLMLVYFIDTWFVASSCIYNCGLVTLDFARLSTYSQVILMLFTISSGVTISTLPALIIKARTHKHERGLRVDNDHSAYNIPSNFEKNPEYSTEAQAKIARLPNAEQLRYRSYLCCLFLIPTACLTIYITSFLCIGSWIQTQYRSSQLRQDGRPVNAWYASFIITVTGFNQNGLTPWSDSLMRFVDDTVLNLLVMLVSIVCLIKLKL